MVDADNGKPVWKFPGSHQIVECRHDEPLGQVPAGTKNRHGGGVKRVAWETLCDSCRGICSDGCHRAPPPLSDVIDHPLRRGEGALASRLMSALLTLSINAHERDFVHQLD